jgi:hypothetical protein
MKKVFVNEILIHKESYFIEFLLNKIYKLHVSKGRIFFL